MRVGKEESKEGLGRLPMDDVGQDKSRDFSRSRDLLTFPISQVKKLRRLSESERQTPAITPDWYFDPSVDWSVFRSLPCPTHAHPPQHRTNQYQHTTNATECLTPVRLSPLPLLPLSSRSVPSRPPLDSPIPRTRLDSLPQKA